MGDLFDELAAEYYDSSRHPTCFDFRRASEQLIERLTPQAEAGRSCEVGTGDSVLAALLADRAQPLEGLLLTDVSAAMLDHSRRWAPRGARLVVAEASRLPVQDQSLELIVGSLADPYDDAVLWREIARVLRPRGTCVLTTPSSTWSERFRADGSAPDVAEFELADGSRLEIPSCIRDPQAEQDLIEANSLEVLDVGFLSLRELGEPASEKLRVLAPDDPVVVAYAVRA